MDKMHESLGRFNRFRGIIRDGQTDQQIGETHYAQADFPVGQSNFFYLGEGELVHFNHIVEKADGPADQCGKLFPVDAIFPGHPG